MRVLAGLEPSQASLKNVSVQIEPHTFAAFNPEEFGMTRYTDHAYFAPEEIKKLWMQESSPSVPLSNINIENATTLPPGGRGTGLSSLRCFFCQWGHQWGQVLFTQPAYALK